MSLPPRFNTCREHPYEEAHGLSLSNDQNINEELSRVDDMAVLVNATISQRR